MLPQTVHLDFPKLKQSPHLPSVTLSINAHHGIRVGNVAIWTRQNTLSVSIEFPYLEIVSIAFCTVLARSLNALGGETGLVTRIGLLLAGVGIRLVLVVPCAITKIDGASFLLGNSSGCTCGTTQTLR